MGTMSFNTHAARGPPPGFEWAEASISGAALGGPAKKPGVELHHAGLVGIVDVVAAAHPLVDFGK